MTESRRQPHLLVVEDDRALAIGLSDAFGLEGFAVTVARDGTKAQGLLRGGRFDGIVLDLMLPGRSGLDVLRELRGRGDATPVLILTARGSEADKVLGLELGADDYVTKPFSLRELVARVRALVRRGAAAESRGTGGSTSRSRAAAVARFRAGDAEVDLAAFEIRRGNDAQGLSKTEAAMLALLHERGGKVVRRAEFLDLAWEHGDQVSLRTIDTHILNLRQKLEADPASPKFLRTVHGVGYRLVDTPLTPD